MNQNHQDKAAQKNQIQAKVAVKREALNLKNPELQVILIASEAQLSQITLIKN